MARRRTVPALLLVLLAVTLACRPHIIVRVDTVVYRDGSLERRVEIVGRTADHETPTEDDWLADDAGIRLAEPEAWDRVERGPGWLRAEGFFLDAGALPALHSIERDSLQRPARTRTSLEVERRVFLERWTYVERHGDPFSAADSAAALDAVVELAVEALTDELEHHFGSGLDPSPAQRFLRGEARSLAQDLLDLSRALPGPLRAAERIEQRAELLAGRGVPVTATGEPEAYWDEQMPALLAWGRDRVAAALSTDRMPVRPDELTFWPLGDDFEQSLEAMIARVWGSDEELLAELDPHLVALAGYYGGGDVPRFRFESRVRLPGTLLKTNGTPDGDSIVWLFRERDLTFGELELRARSVELLGEALVAVGARRDLDTRELVRLADLLWTRDRDGALVELLEGAVARGSFDLLLEDGAVHDELLPVLTELIELLEPDDLEG